MHFAFRRFFKFISFLALGMSLMLVTSCSPKPKKAKAKLNLISSMAISNINMDGGAIIYGQSSAGNTWGRVFKGGNEFVIDMSYGSWSFAIIAYSGPNELQGTAECAILNGVNIGDENQVIDVQINSAACNQAGLRTVLVKPCNQLNYDLVKAGSALTTCGGAGGDGGIQSFRLSFNAHRNGAIEGNSLLTSCIEAVNFEAGGNVLPTGLTNTKANNFNFEGFSGPSCSGTSLFLTGKSLSSATDPNSYFFKPQSANSGTLVINKDFFKIPPTITSISPNAGALAGGTNITITGTDLDPSGTIDIGGVPCSGVSGTATSLNCTTGASTVGVSNVTLTSINGESASLMGGYSYQPTPIVTSLSPTSGPTSGGTNISITGTNFDTVNGSTVDIGGTPCASVTLVSPTLLTCVTNASAAGAYNITVTNNDGDLQTGNLVSAFTFIAPPTVASVAPSNGPQSGGTPITITGTNFLAGATATIGGVACSGLSVNSATSISCMTQAGGPGLSDIVVTNTDGQAGTGVSLYTNNPAPVFSIVNPSNVPETGGTNITITGTNFISGVSITIDGTACTPVTFTSSTTVGCTTPANTSGSYDIVLTNPDGQSVTSVSAITYQTLSSLTISESPPFDFGLVANGGSSQHTFTITNIGQYQATGLTGSGLLAPYSFFGGSYPGSGGSCTGNLAGGDSCDIVVSYAPTVSVLDNDTILIDYNDGQGIQQLSLNIQGTGGTAAFPNISVANFGNVTVGSTTSQLYTLTNNNDLTATNLRDGQPLAAPFQFTGGTYPGDAGTCSATLAGGGATCTIEVSYSPTVLGAANDSIVLYFDNGINPSAVTSRPISGTGVSPANIEINSGLNYSFNVNGSYPVIPTNFLGNYNALSNTPALTDGVGASGDFYISTSTLGSNDYGSGSVILSLGSVVVHDGTRWHGGDPIPSVSLSIQNTGASQATGVSPQAIGNFRYKDGAAYPGVGGDCGTTINTGATCTVVFEIASNLVMKHTAAFVLDYNDGAAAATSSINLQAKVGKITKITGGQGSKCALFDNGKIKCWGRNDYGQLGYGDLQNRGDGPTEMGSNLPFVDLGTNYVAKDIVSGWHHHCALLNNDSIKCWGRGHLGQLGYGDSNNRGDNPAEMANNLPIVPLGGGVTAKRIAAGNFNTCAVLDNANEDLICWGDNSFGQLGQNDTVDRGNTGGTVPDTITPIPVGTNPKPNITIGTGFICAKTAINDIKCWGRNTYGQLGRENITNIQNPATLVTGIDLSVTGPNPVAGNGHICAVGQSQLFCWGYNIDGQLGQDDAINRGNLPTTMGVNLPAVSIPNDISQHMVTDDTTCAMNDVDDIYCFGKGLFGDLGSGSTANLGALGGDISSLTPLDLGAGITPVTLHRDTTCATLDNNEIKCWGYNAFGELGLGDTNNRGDQASEMGDLLLYLELH